MRIAQIVLPGASAYERKSQRVDFGALSAQYEVVVVTSTAAMPRAGIAHVYGPSPLPREPFVGFVTPYVASSAPAARPFPFRKPAQPRVIVSPIDVERRPSPAADGARGPAPLHEILPEAVEDEYFASAEAPPRSAAPHRIGAFARPTIINIVELTLARIHRFREDVEWTLFERPPSPDDLAGVDTWVDPAMDENDLDGFVAEAIAAGKVVVASRIAANVQRLEKGRTGLLVPVGDPNELTHAILAALFKPEVAVSKIEAARQTAGKFRPRQRLRILERIYEDLSR